MVVRHLEILSEKVDSLLSEMEGLRKKNEEIGLFENTAKMQVLGEENKALKRDRQIIREKIKDLLEKLE